METCSADRKSMSDADKHETDRYRECYNKALDLLSRRPHFTRELEAKLSKREHSDEDVQRTLSVLQERKFLNDEEVAKGFVESRRRRLGEVGRRLEMELRKRGVDGALALRVVSAMDDTDEAALAGARATRMRARGASDDKIGRHLSRKGFGKAVILRVLAE